MTQSREFRSDRLVWRFRKTGADGRNTMPFQNLQQATQAKLRRLAEVRPAELPAVACYFDDLNWALIRILKTLWKGVHRLLHTGKWMISMKR